MVAVLPTSEAFPAHPSSCSAQSLSRLRAQGGVTMTHKVPKSWLLIAVSLLLVSMLALFTLGTAQAKGGGGPSNSGHFTCRGSALRAEQLPLVGPLEPVVANPPEDPCVTD